MMSDFRSTLSKLLLGILALLLSLQAEAQPRVVKGPGTDRGLSTNQPVERTDSGDLPFQFSDKDPTRTRVYTLDNGLKVYLSVNKDEPRIQTYIAVNAGSKNDPKETTGLAHYLEHMLFKGTEAFGTSAWKQEKQLLEEIAKLYEEHRNTEDPEAKRRIYETIDQKSSEAAKFAIPNEYDKMLSAMGASGTNAWTSKEETVYTNSIPSNELERWLRVESERFGGLVLRLFHTELEAVYEEYNMSQDRDGSRVWKELFQALFPEHKYGTQTTIGEGEHLKNPSMFNIEAYFDMHYVPNNMAICLAGDFDMDETITLIDQYFGAMTVREKPRYEPGPVVVPSRPIRREVVGKESESVMIAFLAPKPTNPENTTLHVADGILSNGQAGLIDLNLVQSQTVLDAGSFVYDLSEYSVHILSGEPRDGQTLEDVEKHLLAQVDKLKNGAYPDWLVNAVANDLQLNQVRRIESNRGRAGAFVDAFILGMDWEFYISRFGRLGTMNKERVSAFAKEIYKENYVVVYKRQGENSDAEKVEKPAITPVQANREAESAFVSKHLGRKVENISPRWVNYKKSISDEKLASGITLSYIPNKTNELFSLSYILDMGRDHDPLLALAVDYLPYLGTDQYSAAELQQEFFKLGLSFEVFTSRDQSYVTLSGLASSLEDGVKLFEHILNSVQPDDVALQGLVGDILKERQDDKSNKNVILRSAMLNFARYGSRSPFTDRLSENELRASSGADLVQRIKDMTTFEHRVFYYGPDKEEKVISVLDQYHLVPKKLQKYPSPVEYKPLDTKRNKVLFVHYDMVQAQVMMMSKSDDFNRRNMPMSRLFNTYFGSGLSSIVFQEIRETRALAYSAWSSYTTPRTDKDPHYLMAYVATQADKMPEAIVAMQDLLGELPYGETQFEAARESVLKKIASDRITKSSIYWNRESNRRRGIDRDYREDIYNHVEYSTFEDLQFFFDKKIADNQYTYLVIADRTKVDMNMLKGLGEFQELTLEEIFGY